MRAKVVVFAVPLAAAAVYAGYLAAKPKPIVTVPATRATPAPRWPAATLVADFAVPVLMYHRINHLTPDEARSPLMRDLTVSPDDFEQQVAFLKARGFEFLLVSEVEEAIRERSKLPEKAVCITMDDGYKDNFDIALPILRRHGARATIFVVTSSMGKPSRLSWDNLMEMMSGGLSIESHTVTHPDLPSLDDDRLDFELIESRRILKERLAADVRSLAYPAGSFDDRVIQHASDAGYWAAWKKGGGPVMPGADSMRLPRVRVHGRTTLSDFQRKVGSGLMARAIERERRERIAMR